MRFKIINLYNNIPILLLLLEKKKWVHRLLLCYAVKTKNRVYYWYWVTLCNACIKLKFNDKIYKLKLYTDIDSLT